MLKTSIHYHQVDITPIWTNASDPDISDVIRFTDIQPNDFGRFTIDETTGKSRTGDHRKNCSDC